MMSTPKELKATERDTTLTPRQLRAAGFVPATVYGKDFESKSLQVRSHEFSQFYTQGVREFQLTGFMDLSVKAQQVQRDPVSQQPISIEFLKLGGETASKQPKAASKPAKADKPAEEAAPEAQAEPEAETVLA